MQSAATNKIFPLIITGMHRSGTSLTASVFQKLGIDVGQNLYEADANNVRGYFEDVDFLEFQRTVLQKCCCANESGWSDWGWTESEQLDRQKFHNYIGAARELLNSRSDRQSIWGWKDPRTSLMLDFWQNLLPEARYILVYRFPWDVADSILRLHAPIFTEHPDYALRTWCFYNRQIVNFYTANSERCILLSVNQFLKEPLKLADLVSKKFNLKIQDSSTEILTQQVYDPQIFGTLDWQHPTVKLLQKFYPDCLHVLSQLDRRADLPSSFFNSDEYNLSGGTHPEAICFMQGHANIDLLKLALQQHYKLIQAEM